MKYNFVKSAAAFVFLFGCLALVQPAANALSFSDTINFSGGKTITETLFNFGSDFSWTHDINDNLGGENINNVTISDAALTLNFRRTNGANVSLILFNVFNPESWSLQNLGALNSVGNTAANQVLAFGPTALADLQADGLFNIVPQEFTLNAIDLVQRDSFQVFSSTLSGNYTVNPSAPHSPEPFTAFMVFSGLGAAAISRRFKK